MRHSLYQSRKNLFSHVGFRDVGHVITVVTVDECDNGLVQDAMKKKEEPSDEL